MKPILIIFSIITFHLPLKAQEVREFYNGVRSLGMGGATIAVTNDETALLNNPAGLGKLRDYFFTVADPELDLSERNYPIHGLDLMGMIDPDATLGELRSRPGASVYSKAQIFPSIVLPNFGMGLFTKYEMFAQVASDSSTYKVNYQNDMAFVFGFNFRLFDGRLKLGFNTKLINRVEILRDDLDPTASTNTVSNLGKHGFGVGSDVGMILTAPWKYLPTLAIRARDVGNTKFDFKDGLFKTTAEYPEVDTQKVDAAFALFPILGRGKRMVFTLEVRDVLNMSDYEDQNKLYHGGVEFNFHDAFFFRAGYNQRYWTSGVELAVMNYQLQLATYGEEIGTATQPQEDRRYVLKFAYRF
ncbi:MAG: hypothetical protein MK008_00620 [Bdellovibrionales bacterium]|nr:hypothetical protein [Bdellovibrionales bacterium]